MYGAFRHYHNGGEGGIRTPGTVLPVQRFSKPPHSATLPPLQTAQDSILSRKSGQDETWPRKVQPGRAVVTVYRRKTPNGNLAFIVANYADGKRRFDSYLAEAEALDAAHTLAKQIDKRD